uniref:Uncharacterized protein n=1 Tax=Cacopsylla melanoneura TaxID=428564 RepID=A0A8D8M9T8_9HEMI
MKTWKTAKSSKKAKCRMMMMKMKIKRTMKTKPRNIIKTPILSLNKETKTIILNQQMRLVNQHQVLEQVIVCISILVRVIVNFKIIVRVSLVREAMRRRGRKNGMMDLTMILKKRNSAKLTLPVRRPRDPPSWPLQAADNAVMKIMMKMNSCVYEAHLPIELNLLDEP